MICMKTVAFTFCILFVVSLLNAQTDSFYYNVSHKMITRIGSDYKIGTRYTNFRGLDSEFKPSTPGFDLHLKAKKNRKTSAVFRTISLVTLVGTIAATASGNTETGLSFLGGQIVLGGISFYLNKRAIRQSDHAIEMRNDAILYPTR